MITNRISAFLIDIGFSILPIVMVDFYLRSSLEMVLLKSIIIYAIHTSFALVIGGMTVGEKFSRINLQSVKNGNVSKRVLMIKNLVIIMLLINIVVSLENILTAVVALLLFASLNFIISNKNKYEKPMSAIDFIFRTYYAKF